MGGSWQTAEQKLFIEEHLSSYVQHSADETLKTTFWPNFFDKWFKAWPLPESSPNEGGDVQQATKSERKKKIGVSMLRSVCQSTRLTVFAASEACLRICLSRRYFNGESAET